MKRLLVIASPVLIAYAVGIVALPRPQRVDQELAAFDRTPLKGTVIKEVLPAMRTPLSVSFGELALRGVDLPDVALSRGARLAGDLHFEVKDLVDGDWQVFVHLDLQGGQGRINADHWPAAGRYPTHLWQSGEFIKDHFERVIPATAPAGTYDVWVGLYRGDKRKKAKSAQEVLPASFAGAKEVIDDDRVKVGTIVVE